MPKEYIYINGNSSVAIEKPEDGSKIERVFIDGKEHEFEKGDTQDKGQYAIQTKRNKYKKFLNHQFENLVVLTGAGSSVGIGEGDKKGRLLSQLWDDTKEKLGDDKLREYLLMEKNMSLKKGILRTRDNMLFKQKEISIKNF